MQRLTRGSVSPTMVSGNASLSLLRWEWRAVEKVLRAWLAPSNFDEAGRQHTSLEELREQLEREAAQSAVAAKL